MIPTRSVAQGISAMIAFNPDGTPESNREDMTAALDKCVDNLIRQIRKNKTKVEKKIKSGNFDALIPEAPAVEEEVEYKIERQKNIVIKPQTVDEAILQMNLLEHDFYLFENIDTGDINVVYARKEGGYGLLEPEKE